MGFAIDIDFGTSSQLSFDTTLVEVSGGQVRLKDLGGTTYSTANPSVEMQHQLQVSNVTAFDELSNVSGSDLVKYQLLINGSAYWFSAGTWQAADGTYAEANTRDEIDTNLGTLVTDLSIGQPFYFNFRVFLHSASGSTRPRLTTVAVHYTHVYQTAGTLSECLLYAYLSDLLADAYTYDSTKPVTFVVACSRAFFHGNRLIRPFAKSAAFDSNGYMSLSVIETATPGVALEFYLTYYEGNSKKSVKLFNAQVPNASSRAVSEVTSVRDQDAG